MSSGAGLVALSTAPGHLLRRAQQVHTDAWGRLVPPVTGPQYSVLVTVDGWSDIDQKTAGDLASLDKATTAGVVTRLVNSGWILRSVDERDRRRRLLHLTDRARAELPRLSSAAREVQDLLLSALAPERRSRFTDNLAAVARVEDIPVHEQGGSLHALRLATTPGYLLRRAQQLHTAQWTMLVSGVTGPQYAVLSAVHARGVATHTEIGTIASLDSSTTLDVVRRLTARGWLAPIASTTDQRSRPVVLTEPAASALRFLSPAVASVQMKVLGPLNDAERDGFVRDLQCVARISSESTSSNAAH